MTLEDGFSCPIPIMGHSTIQLAHGAGGKRSAELIENIFRPRFHNEILNQMDDQAKFSLPDGVICFTTDSYVVDPIFFPGGNIGDLAINGTVNDLAMGGAKALYLSVSLIIEEGFPMEELHNIALTMELAAKKADILVVTGDTKVVDKGSCDKIFINTSGIGVADKSLQLSCQQLKPGDKIIISGTMADHGMAIMTSRNNLSFESEIRSDTAPLNHLVQEILQEVPSVHAFRDPTRGGVATSLNEWASQSQVKIRLYENSLPVKPQVKSACEILGIDPLYVANEGICLCAVPERDSQQVLAIMKKNEVGKSAEIIGEVLDTNNPGMVTIQSLLGINRIIDMPVGDQLPRIC